MRACTRTPAHGPWAAAPAPITCLSAITLLSAWVAHNSSPSTFSAAHIRFEAQALSCACSWPRVHLVRLRERDALCLFFCQPCASQTNTLGSWPDEQSLGMFSFQVCLRAYVFCVRVRAYFLGVPVHMDVRTCCSWHGHCRTWCTRSFSRASRLCSSLKRASSSCAGKDTCRQDKDARRYTSSMYNQ